MATFSTAVHQLDQTSKFISRSCCKDVNARQPSLVTLERYHSGKAIRSGQTPLCLVLVDVGVAQSGLVTIWY